MNVKQDLDKSLSDVSQKYSFHFDAVETIKAPSPGFKWDAMPDNILKKRRHGKLE